MRLYESTTYISDLDLVIKHTKILQNFEGKSILITGASGLIGSAIVDLIMRYNEVFSTANIKVYAAGRNEKKLEERFYKYHDSDYLNMVKYDAKNAIHFNFVVDYIVHGASNAFPSIIQKQPIETMLNNFIGMFNLLKYAKECDVVNTVFISSSEVYGRKDDSYPFLEGEYGFLDILDPRSSYSSSKRAAETLCSCFSYEYDMKTNIVRPGHIYGPTASKEDNRVSSAFAYDVVNHKDLLLKSDGSQMRSYCYTLDCATAILTVLIKGVNKEAYNISNPNSIISIKEIAEKYAKFGNVNLKYELPNLKEKQAFNPMKNSSLNGNKLLMLGWTGLFDADTGVEHTVKILNDVKVYEKRES